MTDIFCVGEMVIDFLPGKNAGEYVRHAGGAPANVAIAVSRLGFNSAIACKVGDDDFGHFLTDTLKTENVVVAGKPYTDKATTTMAFVTLKDGMKYLMTELRKDVKIDIALHCHNDFGLAVINSITGILAGAKGISTTVNGIGERAGSGIPDIYQVWENEGWPMPVVEESYNPDRTRLSLEFVKKQTIKTNDKKQTTKTESHREKIREFLTQTELASARDIAEIIGLSAERTRVILSKMDDVEPVGENRNRMYMLKK